MTQNNHLDRQEILNLIQQGDPNTIATFLNRHLASQGIRAIVAWKNAYLGILLEAATTPDKKQALDFLNRYFADLTIESVKAIRIYGRQVGQIAPTWSAEIEVKKTEHSDLNILSLAEWLSQGVEVETTGIFLDADQKLFGDLDNLKFLRFHYNFEDTALFPLSKVKEVLNVPIKDILPVPHMADCLVGIYHCRGEILWLIDLGQQLGFIPSVEYYQPSVDPSSVTSQELSIFNSESKSFLNVIIIQDGAKFIGIVVPKVVDIEMHNLQEMRAASSELFPAKIFPFIQGYLTRCNTPVLDVKSLIEEPQLQFYQYQ